MVVPPGSGPGEQRRGHFLHRDRGSEGAVARYVTFGFLRLTNEALARPKRAGRLVPATGLGPRDAVVPTFSTQQQRRA
jgi:hypothetical protein